MSLPTVSKHKIVSFGLHNAYIEGLNQLKEIVLYYNQLNSKTFDDACVNKCMNKMARMKRRARDMIEK